MPAARLEWWLGQSLPPGVNEPAELLEHFLTRHGLAVGDLSSRAGTDPAGPSSHTVCGAAVFLSAAASAAMAGALPGRPTPAPDVPDLTAIVYANSRSTVTQSSDLGSGPGSADLDLENGSAPNGTYRACSEFISPAGRETWTGGDSRTGGIGGMSGEPWRLGAWRPSWTPAEHAGAVQAVREAIARGDVYQVNVVGHAAAAYTGDPRPALRRLATLRGAHYAGLIEGDGWAIACASPETLVSVRDGVAVTRPIKGTARATEEGRRELLASEKERAEHVMIVDLERNDLARIAEIGSVSVDELFALRHWGDLWQAESTVAARLRPGTGLAALLRALCPGGSVTGAPKLAALAEIARLEPVGRGASMGAFGWVGHDHVDLGLTIRTVAATRTELHLWAGGGITWGSDPAAEVAEAAAKAAPIRALLAS
nr:chorismate-binding protein [Hamadaea tsunoensis]